MKSVIFAVCLPSLAIAFATKPSHQQRRGQNVGLNAESSSSRQPWELGRFVQQSSKFVNLNPLAQKAVKQEILPGDVVWEPSDAPQFRFGPLDDVVMGGVSASTFDNTSGKWTGSVTDANNGGFVGIRSFPNVELDMTQCTGLEVELKQNNTPCGTRRYKISLRDSTDFNGIVWACSVNVQGGNQNPILRLFDSDATTTTTTVRIPFDKLQATKFANIVPNQKLSEGNVVAFQLTYSKFEYNGNLNPNFVQGDVDLQILKIRAY